MDATRFFQENVGQTSLATDTMEYNTQRGLLAIAEQLNEILSRLDGIERQLRRPR